MTTPLQALWAKSDASGEWHSLVGHLLDAGAVGELIWDEFLAPATRSRLNEAARGQGRDVLILCCALHDLGKATPVFQAKVEPLGGRVAATGLTMTAPDRVTLRDRPHARAGAYLLMQWLRERDAAALDWTAALIQGHHGRHEPAKDWRKRSVRGDGDAAWAAVQRELADHMVEQFGIDPASLAGPIPSRAVQLALAGHVVMADWIASCSLFPGDGGEPVGLEGARRRARAAWSALGFAPGLQPERLAGQRPLSRFGVAEPRPVQRLCVEVAAAEAAPGLSILEAPMGEGKTEAGLAMAEVLAQRFGCNGVLFAMPTQGTTDAMYERFCVWAQAVDSKVPVSLLHGKAMLNETWRARQAAATTPMVRAGMDSYGMPVIFDEEEIESDRAVPDWLLGRHRSLLSHLIVCTIDQVLYAATRTKFVSLRHAGLSGKVLIIDEVHSYDVYMSAFLDDLLTWCAAGGVPVVLMSATLAPSLRRRLVCAYRQGLGEAAPMVEDAQLGYPRLTAVSREAARAVEARAYRPDLDVDVEVAQGDPDDLVSVASRLVSETEEGGCVLAILDTVARAQALYALVKESGVDATLLHGRLTTAARAATTARLVDALGAQRTLRSGRPSRHVIVATQIAEQSFDVDADLLFTDIAPMDLLLQRVGRLHRHQRPSDDRPAGMRRPRVVVLGTRLGGGAPEFAAGPMAVYGPRALLRTAEELQGIARWSIPSQVPGLVARAYREEPLPEAWHEAYATLLAEERADTESRASRAREFTLTSDRAQRVDLAGLHYLAVHGSDDEAATVRDAESSRDVALVVQTAAGYRSLGGIDLGPNGERCSSVSVARAVWGDTVRLRDSGQMQWVRELPPLAGWKDLPLVGRLPALLLGDDLASLEHPEISYDPELGLLIDHRSSR